MFNKNSTYFCSIGDSYKSIIIDSESMEDGALPSSPSSFYGRLNDEVSSLLGKQLVVISNERRDLNLPPILVVEVRQI